MSLGDWRHWQNYWLAALLALAMVLGPTLGQMHRAVHAGGSAQTLATALAGTQGAHAPHALASGTSAVCLTPSTSSEAADAANGSACSDWVHALFAGHGPAQCQLLDQANHGFAGPPAVLHFAGVVPDSAQPAPYLPRPRAIFVAASFDARAPPASQLPRA